jgi:polyhydroxyalkanoate synthesis repressor PhaR
MLTIKRYPNRKFYDTEEKRYMTLEDITAHIQQGRDIQVIDNTTGEDITPVVLTQIILEQEKKQTGFVPRSVLTGLVQAGGLTVGRMRKALANPLDLLKQIDEEIELRIDELIKHGEIAEEEARRWRDKLLSDDISPTEDELLDEKRLQRLLDERGVPSRKDIKSLSDQLEELVQKMEELQSKSDN